MANITKKMKIGDVVDKYPVSAMIMMKYGLHCIGCGIASLETIEQGAKGHGINDKKINEMIDKINKAVKKSEKNI